MHTNPDLPRPFERGNPIVIDERIDGLFWLRSGASAICVVERMGSEWPDVVSIPMRRIEHADPHVLAQRAEAERVRDLRGYGR